MKDYYKVLGIRATASGEDIRARWIELMRKFHPDGQTVGGAEDERLKEINEAYGVLKHPSARAHYDLQRAYYRRKRGSYLRRMILPSTILIVFFILGLTYLQRHRVAPLSESPPPSARGSIGIKANPPLNETYQMDQINQMNQTNEIDEINQTNRINQTDEKDETNEINEIDQKDETTQIAHPKSLPLIAKSGTSITAPRTFSRAVSEKSKVKSNDLNKTDQISEIDETNQTDQTDHTNQTDQTYVPREKKASPLFAKAETSPSVRKPIPLPSGLSKIDQIDEINQINQTNQIVAQLKPTSLIATEDEVKQFLARYIDRYAQKDIEGFHSLFSPEAVQNGRDGFDGIKKIYSDFFDQSQELRYHMEGTRIDIYQNAVHVKARYKVDQILKKGRKKKFWKGDIRLILIRENGALKIRYLDFRSGKSR